MSEFTVVYTDLDGTLLDPVYDWQAAAPALDLLRRRGIPVVFVTSKTRAETELWRDRLGIRDPFIVENGGALFVPDGHGYRVVEFGAPYTGLVAALARAARAAGAWVRGFAGMTEAEVARETGLDPGMARLAKRREYDEPFLLTEGGEDALRRAIVLEGYVHCHGGRFHHILGGNDKAAAVRCLDAMYGRPRSIGLGDAENDLGFLGEVTHPVLVRSAQTERLRRALPRAKVTTNAGPAGWCEAVLGLLG